MNLTDIKPTQTAKQFSNSIENTFGVKVDVGKLDLDKSAKLLLSVNEQIQKQRLSEDRHKLHTTKSYLAKIFIKENLEKHIAELTDNEEKKTESRLIKLQELKDITARMAALEDNITELQEGKGEEVIEEELTAAQKKLPQGLQDAIAKKQGNSEESVEEEADEEDKLTERTQHAQQGGPREDEWSFDPRGMTALRMLVGSQQMARAKRAIEMAKRGRAVPATYMTAFIPLIDILDDIMRSGMANVQMLKNLDKRAKRSLGIDKMESIDPEIQMKNENIEQVSDRLRGLYESQEDQAELLLASKDVVDRVQKAVDDLSKLRNEDLPPLLDAMRDEVGAEISSAYANIAIPTLDQLVSANGMGRETLAQASRILTGEEQLPQAMGAEAPAEEVPAETLPAAEEFETADVAAGEAVEAGRAERI